MGHKDGEKKIFVPADTPIAFFTSHLAFRISLPLMRPTYFVPRSRPAALVAMAARATGALMLALPLQSWRLANAG